MRYLLLAFISQAIIGFSLSAQQWTAMNNGLTNQYVKCLTVNGTNIYAGTFGKEVFRSTNNATSWTVGNIDLTNQDIRCLTANGTNIFAGTFNGGVYRSTNSGTSWTAVNNGLTLQ